jgi:hypothetical protein
MTKSADDNDASLNEQHLLFDLNVETMLTCATLAGELHRNGLLLPQVASRLSHHFARLTQRLDRSEHPGAMELAAVLQIAARSLAPDGPDSS